MDANNLYEVIRDSVAKGYLINGAVGGCSNADLCEKLIGGHAYSIINTTYIKSMNTVGVLVRNPWGVDTYNGTLSDTWMEEHTDVKEEIEHEVRKDDGCFWIPADKYYHYFGSLTIGQ